LDNCRRRVTPESNTRWYWCPLLPPGHWRIISREKTKKNTRSSPHWQSLDPPSLPIGSDSAYVGVDGQDLLLYVYRLAFWIGVCVLGIWDGNLSSAERASVLLQ